MFYTSRKRTAELAPTILRPKFPAKLLSNFPGSFRELSIFLRTFLFARKNSGVACWGSRWLNVNRVLEVNRLFLSCQTTVALHPCFWGATHLALAWDQVCSCNKVDTIFVYHVDVRHGRSERNDSSSSIGGSFSHPRLFFGGTPSSNCCLHQRRQRSWRLAVGGSRDHIHSYNSREKGSMYPISKVV